MASSGANYSCPAASRLINKTQPQIFNNTPSIVGVHQVSRWGHTNNITQALTGTDADKKNYITGLVVSSIVMCIFFLSWMIILIVLKCLGYRLVGFLSGNNVRIPARPTSTSKLADNNEVPDGDGDGNDAMAQDNEDEAAELEAWERSVKIRERRVTIIRIVVIVSGLIIVVASALMVAFGIQSVHGAARDTRRGLQQGTNLANSAIELIDNFMQNQNETAAVAQNVTDMSAQIDCVKQIICVNAVASQCTLIFDQIPAVLQSKKETAVAQLIDTRSDLVRMSTILTDVNQTIGRFDWSFWVAAGAVLLMAVCTLLMLNGVILAWQKKLHGTCWQRTTSCIRGWFIVPIFVFLLIIGFIFSMVFVIGSLATSDFCYDSPNGVVLAVLNQYKDQFQTTLFKTLVFYVSGCPGSAQIIKAGQEIIPKIQEAMKVVLEVSSSLQQNNNLILTTCNETPVMLNNALSFLENQICNVWTSLLDVIDFFTCANFNGLYATVAYDAICYNGNTGFVWISSTQFVILFFAMIMLTLRVAFYEMVDESELIQPRGCCRRRGAAQNKEATTDPHAAEPQGDGIERYDDDEPENPVVEADNNVPDGPPDGPLDGPPDGPKHAAVVE